ncbi:hypothetical protein Hypma_003860 [Hypsizygus marmoreus]|uniref:Uncharacterized protein n=1 Tax=Hypsizygus marmoreus TaxID=39966 RepID=A0A369JYQ1_HYPMA|nr:hypothetical protein Hypma_003860 [Hypsizygus marmoreus]
MLLHPMQSSNLVHYPSTPVAQHIYHGTNYRPLNSSPLATPSTPKKPSPVAARRRIQFKQRTPSTPVASSSRTHVNSRSVSSSGGSVFGGEDGQGSSFADDPQKAFLREKFKARCFERAAKARAKAIRGRRYASEMSSDGFDEPMDEDEEEDDDAIMHDELFRRIMENANRKEKHSYRVSYAHDVGSSFDPDMDNVDEWEDELGEPHNTHARPSSGQSEQPQTELTPVDLEDEELEAYAEECARRAAIADFEDVPEDELFSWSDVEELDEARRRQNDDLDIEMIR